MTRGLEPIFKLSTYDYNLDKTLIAQHPADHRDESRLEVLLRGSPREHQAQEHQAHVYQNGYPRIEHRSFSDIVQYFKAGDLLVLNNTHVIPARLIAKKVPTGGIVKVLLVRALKSESIHPLWEVLIQGSVSAGHLLKIGDELEIRLIERFPDGRWTAELLYSGLLYDRIERVGLPPLPPYIKREATESDRLRYQTVYSNPPGSEGEVVGSIAAPTAGLHFTQPLLEKIMAQGVRVAFLTLHIGLGTFRPVKSEDIRLHRMDPEYFEIPPEAQKMIDEVRSSGGRIIAVGTSVTRVLETAGSENGYLKSSGSSDLFIFPGYQFKMVQGLITNFHMPKSTLFMLVCAFSGLEKIMAAYDEAQRSRYRFLSFGDAMLIL